MARKAICFYKALIINNELSPDSCCEIYSSRILSYNIWDKLKNKRIALIDDVVIHGASLAQAQNILLSHNIDVDIYIVAWMKQFDTDNTTSDLLANIQEPFVHLDEIDIYSYTNYITRYIEASMIPYNIDQPIVLTEYTDHSLETFTRDHRLTDITSSVQKKFHIQNRVIHYSGAILKPVLGSVEIDLNDVYNWCLNALNNAIKSYNADNNAIFSTYATTIVENSIKNYLRNNCKTNEKLNIVIEPFYENQAITYLDFTINYNTDPYYTLSDQEHLSELLIAIKNALSPFEYKVYVLLLNNLKYQDIAKKLNKTPKQIDNAIQRIKNKLKMVLKSMKIA